MTTEEFLYEVQDYFGEYSPTQRKYVKIWLEQRTDTERRQVFITLIKTISTQYRQVPDVATLIRIYGGLTDEQKRERILYPVLPPGTDPAEERERILNGDEAGAYFTQVWEELQKASQKKTEWNRTTHHGKGEE